MEENSSLNFYNFNTKKLKNDIIIDRPLIEDKY